MTKDNAKENSVNEARRGDEVLGAARHLLSHGFYNDAISRAYYAAYHWARGLLVTRGLESKTHRGVIQLLNLHFVKDGPLAELTAAHLAHLETYRELSDYTAVTHFTETQAREEITHAVAFINACCPLIELPAKL